MKILAEDREDVTLRSRNIMKENNILLYRHKKKYPLKDRKTGKMPKSIGKCDSVKTTLDMSITPATKPNFNFVFI